MSKFRIVSILLILVLFVSQSAAQQSNDLFAYSEGDIWRWSRETNTAEQLTFWGLNGGPILSPDGRWIAYQSVAAEVADQVNNGTWGNVPGAVPMNIWVMETATEDFERVAPQETGTSIVRSVPTWSPDSTRLVWSELRGGFNPYASLVVYDFRTGQRSTLTSQFSMGFQDGGYSMPMVQWGAGGISRMLFTYVEGGIGQSILEIYNPISGELTSFVLGTTQDSNNLVFEHVWVGDDVALMTVDGSWSVLNPQSGGRTSLSQAPVLSLANGSSVALRPVFTHTTGFTWQVEFEGRVISTGYSTPTLRAGWTPTLAPNGVQVAWNEDGYARIWQPGTNAVNTVTTGVDTLGTMRYENPVSVVWAPLRWTIDAPTGGVVPPPVLPPLRSRCDLPTRVSAGDTIIINGSLPSNIRAGAGVNAPLLGVLGAGHTGTVFENPVCVDGYYWVHISYADGEGWTAEGDDGVYWLSPYQSAACSNSPAPRLTVNSSGYVLPGDANAVRDGVGTSGTSVIGYLDAGAVFRVLGAGACGNDGRRWYPVEYNGLVGWTAEGDGNTYWLAPFDSATCSNSPAPRLRVGDGGYVLPGDSNALRTAAGTADNSTVMGYIPAGWTFYVAGDAVCGNDGRRWWYVEFGGRYGWTAEGEGNTYWLAPVGS